jgi:hypothetical protein
MDPTLDGSSDIFLKAGRPGNIFVNDTNNGAGDTSTGDCDFGNLDGKIKFQLNVEYYVAESGETFKHNSTGTLLAKLEGTD